MSIPPTPIYIARIQEIVNKGKFIHSKIDVETLKIVSTPNTECLGVFTGPRTARLLVRWCFVNIHRGPICNCYDVDTPRLFDEKTLERVMQVVQALWCRTDELEREVEALRSQ